MPGEHCPLVLGVRPRCGPVRPRKDMHPLLLRQLLRRQPQRVKRGLPRSGLVLQVELLFTIVLNIYTINWENVASGGCGIRTYSLFRHFSVVAAAAWWKRVCRSARRSGPAWGTPSSGPSSGNSSTSLAPLGDTSHQTFLRKFLQLFCYHIIDCFLNLQIKPETSCIFNLLLEIIQRIYLFISLHIYNVLRVRRGVGEGKLGEPELCCRLGCSGGRSDVGAPGETSCCATTLTLLPSSSPPPPVSSAV